MDENIKNRVILILALLCIILFVGLAGSCNSAYKQKVSREEEMAKRLELEERFSNFPNERKELEKKIADLTTEYATIKDKYTQAQRALQEQALINQNLKEELEKVINLKEALEEDLKEALAKNKTRTKK